MIFVAFQNLKWVMYAKTVSKSMYDVFGWHIEENSMESKILIFWYFAKMWKITKISKMDQKWSQIPGVQGEKSRKM